MMNRLIRPLHGAGRWFPGEATALRQSVESCIAQSDTPPPDSPIIAALAPHAGYPYSGPVAGHTFKALQDHARIYGMPETVLILGFSHSERFPGVAIMDGDAVSSPLGETELDQEAADILCAAGADIHRDYERHIGEHSAENEVPFVQSALPGTKLVIGLFGDHRPESIEQLVSGLKALEKKRRFLIVASTDMTHAADYEHVCQEDQKTLDQFRRMDIDGLQSSWSYDHQCFCGIMPVLTAMTYARDKGCGKGDVLFYQNSGDIDPDSRGRWVVGYTAAILREPPPA